MSKDFLRITLEDIRIKLSEQSVIENIQVIRTENNAKKMSTASLVLTFGIT